MLHVPQARPEDLHFAAPYEQCMFQQPSLHHRDAPSALSRPPISLSLVNDDSTNSSWSSLSGSPIEPSGQFDDPYAYYSQRFAAPSITSSRHSPTSADSWEWNGSTANANTHFASYRDSSVNNQFLPVGYYRQ